MTPRQGSDKDSPLTVIPNAASVREQFPDVARALALIGEPVTDDFLRQFERRYGSGHLFSLLNRDVSGGEFWNLWTTARDRPYRELFELLVLEDTLCSQPAHVSSGFSTSKKLARLSHF